MYCLGIFMIRLRTTASIQHLGYLVIYKYVIDNRTFIRHQTVITSPSYT